ncbi:MAG TPA: DHH family phosphoesterase [Candidatus Saccharimonadales bacterium]|nr:DHH family phosphoesterase [Candidatus Saccharimonadales bacterium]
METPHYGEADKIRAIVDDAQKIVIVQADNPDADSLGSALALEHLLGDLGKDGALYCAVDVPTYLRYLPGWDRVQKELPRAFDASIIVDASTMTLFERLENSGEKGWLAGKPCVVLDHHKTVENLISFATVTINDHQRASTGELIYLLAQALDWPLSVQAQELLMVSILGDTQGLTNQLASAETYRIMAAMVEAGADRPALEEKRREAAKMPPEIYRYKAELIRRSQFAAEGKIASVSVPQAEINQYSPLYNPAPLIQNDMLQTAGVLVAIVFKAYDDGKVTAAIRCNPSAPIGAKLAEQFGGGGHDYASGFKVTGGRALADIEKDCLARAGELLATLHL